ncbi:MAG: hypothetical protein IPM29_13605 [Planctomycetes bacterium]|nr:hypothetical protein [Planctomycetota bacterium]
MHPRLRRAVPVLLASLVLAGHGPAQDDVSARIAAAVQGADWDLELSRAGLRERPIAELVDALVPLRGRLHGHLWVRAVSLVKSRDVEVDALWRDEPARRRGRAEVFADALGGWIERHVAADPPERADIEYLARFLPPRTHHPDRDGRLDQPRWLGSALVLQRISAAAQRAHAEVVTEALRAIDRPGSAGAAAVLGHDPSAGPFALADALTDPEPRVRLAAAVALRLRLGAAVPPWLAREVADDPTLHATLAGLLPALPVPPFDAAAVERLLADLAADRWPLARIPQPDDLDSSARRRISAALIAFARRRPPPAAPTPESPPAPFWIPAVESAALIALRAAAALDAEGFTAVLALGAPSTPSHLRFAALTALAAIRPLPAAAATAAAQPLGALLDDPDPAIAELTASVCAAVLPQCDDPALRDLVADRALAVLNGDPAALRVRPGLRFCGTGPPPAGTPEGRDAWLLFAASTARDPRLVGPLLDALGTDRFDPRPARTPWPDSQAVELLLTCVAEFAEELDADQARRVHELLAPLVPSTSGPGLATRVHVLARQILDASYPRVPDDLVVWYAARDLWSRIACAWLVEPRADRLTAARASALIGTSDADRDAALRNAPWLFLLAPDRLPDLRTASQHARSEFVRAIQGTLPRHAARVVDLAARGELPRDVVAASLALVPLELRQLAAVVPTDPSGAWYWAPALASAIGRAVRAAPTDDLAAVRQLAAAPAIDVTVAALRRATTLGEPGVAFARAALDRLVAPGSDDESAARALQLAIEVGIEPRELPAVCDRLAASRSWFATMLADAAAFRFAELDPRSCRSPYPARAIGAAGIDVAVDVLREALTGQSGHELVELLQGCSPATCRAALQLIAERPVWDSELERAVVWKTSDDDPGIRLAAYRALASRDAELWPCALLRQTGTFDPAPEIREFARGER